MDAHARAWRLRLRRLPPLMNCTRPTWMGVLTVSTARARWDPFPIGLYILTVYFPMAIPLVAGCPWTLEVFPKEPWRGNLTRA